MKKQRHEKILELIELNEIETQEGLQALLKGCGFDVTQATVSRDIKELRLVKKQSKSGRYSYTAPDNNNHHSRLKSIFSDSVVKVDYAMNTVVLKCRTGTAQAACAALDTMGLENIVGTLAGDDTIFILMRNEHSAKALTAELEGTLKI